MRNFFVLLALLLGRLCLNAEPYVAVITIDSEIDAPAWRHLSRALRDVEGRPDRPAAVILDLNTYGGAVDVADSMRTALRRCPLPTVAFINHNAASAGALVALACDSVYMAPGSSMGAATVVNGQGEPMPPKYQNYWSSVMRSTAMSHGKYTPEGDSLPRWRRDPALAADMVTPDKTIALTAQEAVEAGMADGVAPDLNAVLKDLNLSDTRVERIEISQTDALMGFLASAAVRAVLVMLILGGLYFEMHTPGMGFAAAVALVAAVLYFLPAVVTGTLALWVVLTFILGVVLLALELFVIPGFGVAGAAGIIAILTALIGTVLHSDGLAIEPRHAIFRALAVVGVGTLLAGVAAWLLTSRLAPKRLQRATMLTHEQRTESGYVGVDMSLSALVGRSGVAVTDLRPAGKVAVDGHEYDAASTGAFITAGSPVNIIRHTGAQLVVEALR